jgi:hypothetical protein
VVVLCLSVLQSEAIHRLYQDLFEEQTLHQGDLTPQSNVLEGLAGRRKAPEHGRRQSGEGILTALAVKIVGEVSSICVSNVNIPILQ